jgi:alkylated DNA repair dioxygenase AlkB
MIPGLSLTQDFLNASQCEILLAFLLAKLETQPTTSDPAKGRTRILRYGHDYDAPHKWLREIPDKIWFFQPGNGYNSVTVNEYPPGHGIAAHKDSPDFPAPIHILSLNSTGIIEFSRKAQTQQLTLHPGSLLTMSGDSLTKWFHATLPVFTPKNRYSVVFRNLKA